MTEIISKIDKYAGEIKKMIDKLDPKTEIYYSCEFGNEDLEEIFLEQLQDVSILIDDTEENAEAEEKYLLGNIDTVVDEFFKKTEVIKERLQFHDEDEDVEDDEEENTDDYLDEIENAVCEDEANIYDDDDFEDHEIEGDEDEVEDDEEIENDDDEEIENDDDEGEDFDEEVKNYINFYIPLKDERYINISYTPQFDENFNITGIERNITLEI